MRGPSSSLYGNASGGLINIQTQAAPDVPVLFQPGFTVGSDGLFKWQGKISGTVWRNSYVIDVNEVVQDGYREHSARKTTLINAVTRQAVSDHFTLTSAFNFTDSPYLLSPSTLDRHDAETIPESARYYVKQQGSGEKSHQGQGGLTLKYFDELGTQFNTSIYGLSRSVLNAFPGSIIKLERSSWGVRSVWRKPFSLGTREVNWTIGADFDQMDDSRREFENLGIPEDQVDTADKEAVFDLLGYGPILVNRREKLAGFGPFTELEVLLTPQWQLNLGLRYDYYHFRVTDNYLEDDYDGSGTRIMDKMSPMAGLLYCYDNWLKVYLNFSTAFQTPTISEMSIRPIGESGLNSSLKPETLQSFEVGLKGMWPPVRRSGTTGVLNFDLSVFSMSIDDMLVPFQRVDSESERVYYRNAGKTRNNGAEIRLDFFPIDGLTTTLTYTYMDFTFVDFKLTASGDDTGQTYQLEGNVVPGMPAHQLFAGIKYDHPLGAYTELNLRWMDQCYTNDFNGPPPGSDKPTEDFVNDSYVIVDIRAGYQHHFKSCGCEIFLGLNNLFDESYNSAVVPNAMGDRFFYPAPGQNWYSGIIISFPQGGK